MFKSRGITALFAIIAMLMLLSPLGAEELSQKFSHSLSLGNPAQSYEHRIDLPENWAAEGKYFVGRSLAVDGKLVIEREELSKTYYYVKVRLPKATLWFAKGSINISLKAEKDVSPAPALSAPADLKVNGGYYPRFSWNGSGNYSAISLLDRSNGGTVWERVILNAHKCDMDEGNVRIGGKYAWAVKQSDNSGRYSLEATRNFRVDATQERCRQCFGHGYITCRYCHGSGHVVVNGPNNTPVTQVCHQCNGTGRERCLDCNGHGYITVPTIVDEGSFINLNELNEENESAARTILDGEIKEIKLAEADSDRQGVITVGNETVEKSFKVSRHTLILIIDLQGYARVTELKYLKKGWKCSLAYDVPADDENPDFAEDSGEGEIKFADNMIVQYAP